MKSGLWKGKYIHCFLFYFFLSLFRLPPAGERNRVVAAYSYEITRLLHDVVFSFFLFFFSICHLRVRQREKFTLFLKNSRRHDRAGKLSRIEGG